MNSYLVFLPLPPRQDLQNRAILNYISVLIVGIESIHRPTLLYVAPSSVYFFSVFFLGPAVIMINLNLIDRHLRLITYYWTPIFVDAKSTFFIPKIMGLIRGLHMSRLYDTLDMTIG